MDSRCERCLKSLPTDHVGDLLCGPCRREAGVREVYLTPRPAPRPVVAAHAAALEQPSG